MNIDIPADDLFIWEQYSFQCCIHPGVFAVCLHESPPKSLNPRWREQPWTRFPVCNDCHLRIHEMKRKESSELLLTASAKNYPNALRRLKEWKSN